MRKEESTGQLALSVEEARKRLGISRGLMYSAISRGLIPSVRISKRILIPTAGISRFLEQTGNKENKT